MTTAQLQSKIRQLEADNASLAFAAEEAAQLAEEYAADAAKWRARSVTQEESLVNELTDAARRKDRRIQRLTTLLDTERTKNEQLENRNKELEELNALSAEMEETLHTSIRMLQSQLKNETSGPSAKENVGKPAMPAHTLFLRAAQAPTARSILESIEAYFPHDSDVRGDIATFSVLLRFAYVQEIVFYLINRTSAADVEPLQKLLSDVKECTTRAHIWCLEDPAEFPFRGRHIMQEVLSLEERVSAFFNEYSSTTKPPAWSREAGKMMVDLVRMSLDSLNSMIPKASAPANAEDDNNSSTFCEATLKRAKVVATRLENLTRQEQIRNSEALLQSKLNATQTLLSQRERELEDMRVRTRVFEERLSTSVEDTKEFDAQTAKISTLEAQLQLAQESLTKQKERDAQPVHSVQTKQAEVKTKEPNSQPKSDLNQRKLRLLQLEMARRHLVDLAPLPTCTTREGLDLKEETAFYETISSTLHDARLAASNARALRLDPNTLQPITRGATLSRKGLIQASALVRRKTNRKVMEAYDYRSAVDCEIRLNSSQNLASLVRLARSSDWL